VVSGNGELVSAVRALLSSIDAPGRQVMVEVRVADVQPVNDTTDVGVQLGGTGFGAGALAQFPYTITKSSVLVNAQIDTLIQHGRASILAEPRIATLNNREASLLIGEQYPVVTVNQQTGFPSVQTIDVGVRLRLTPTIGDDGRSPRTSSGIFSNIGFNDSFRSSLTARSTQRCGSRTARPSCWADCSKTSIPRRSRSSRSWATCGAGTFFRNRQTTHSKTIVFFITPHVLGASDKT